MMTEKSMIGNRRQFMKLTAAATVGIGTVGTKGVIADGSQLADPGLGQAEIDAAFEAHTSGLFDLLAEEGLLEGGLAALPTDEQISVSDAVANEEGTAHFAIADRPDVVKTVTHVDGGVLKVSVIPEEGTSHAVFIPDGEEVQYVYDAEEGHVGVERDEVWTNTECWCEDLVCDGFFFVYFCCDDGDCYGAGCC